MNKRKENEREANGKPRKLADRSMERKYESGAADDVLGQNAFLDLTDVEQDEVSCARSSFGTADLVAPVSLSTSIKHIVLPFDSGTGTRKTNQDSRSCERLSMLESFSSRLSQSSIYACHGANGF
jgi:hypothetical protein